MKVYMTGLIYLNGCNDDVRAYATKAIGHHASLWVDAGDLDEGNTTWWPDLRHAARTVGKDAIIEFEIPGPADVRFPGEGPVDCSGLEDGLPRLKKRRKKEKEDDPDEPEQDFHVNTETAQTNAEVAVRGGSIAPRRFQEVSLVEWTITDQGLAIVVTSRDNPEDSSTITLNNADADVLFLNTHDLPEEHGDKDLLAGNHVSGHKNLNPEPNVTVYSTAARVPGRAGQLAKERSPHFIFLKAGGCSCGSSTCCC